MKRLTVVAIACAMLAGACDEVLNPASPSSQVVTLSSQMAAARVLPGGMASIFFAGRFSADAARQMARTPS
jgi:hypothetical protein